MNYVLALSPPKPERRRLLLIFLAAITLHGLLLLVPSVRKEFVPRGEGSSLAVRLVAEPSETQRKTMAPALPAADVQPPVEATEPERLTRESTAAEPPVAAPDQREDRAAESEVERKAARALATRIVSSPYLDDSPRRFDPFPADSEFDRGGAEFRLANRSTPDPLIYPEPVPLPFGDAPRFAVEFYDPGVMGGVQRFWDSVTFAKTWTTEGGTRISCGVVLIIPACAWD